MAVLGIAIAVAALIFLLSRREAGAGAVPEETTIILGGVTLLDVNGKRLVKRNSSYALEEPVVVENMHPGGDITFRFRNDSLQALTTAVNARFELRWLLTFPSPITVAFQLSIPVPLPGSEGQAKPWCYASGTYEPGVYDGIIQVKHCEVEDGADFCKLQGSVKIKNLLKVTGSGSVEASAR